MKKRRSEKQLRWINSQGKLSFNLKIPPNECVKAMLLPQFLEKSCSYIT